MKNKLTLLVVFIFVSCISYSQTWNQMLNGRGVWSLAKDNYGNVFAGGLTSSNSRVWKSTDYGNSWDTVYVGSGQTMWDFAFDYSGNMYVAHYSTGLLKSTDQGQNFSLIPSSAFNNKNLQGVKCGSTGYIFITTSMGFFRSTDNGQTFNETALTGLNCLPVLVDIDSSNIIYVGVTGSTSVGFYRSTDNGLTFSANLNPGKNGYNLVQKPNGDLFMITTTSPYNFSKSTNKGLTWTTSSNTASSQRGIMYSLSGNFYTSGNGGVFRSTDDGMTFSNFNFTNSATPILSVNDHTNLKVFAGTAGSSTGGVWICTEGPSPLVNVNLKVTPEGLFNDVSNPLNRRDTVSLYIRDAASPYRLRDSARAVIDSLNFTGMYAYHNTPSGLYYLVVKHFNTLETWSESGGESLVADGSFFNYDFTTSISKAYGNNLQLKGGLYCIYSGDVNQNGFIDVFDLSETDNDAFNFVSGYVVTDVNGNNFVDLLDLAIIDNNVYSFVSLKRP